MGFHCLSPTNRRTLLVMSLTAILCLLTAKLFGLIGLAPVGPNSDRDRREVKTVPLWSFDTNLFNFGDNKENDQSDGLLRPQPVVAGSRCGLPALSPIGVRKEFLEKLPLILPDDYSKPMEVILEEDWVCDLQEFLSKVDPERRLVNMIAANSNFTDPLLNWLISSHLRLEEPMIDVIVISLDSPLHELLIDRGIPSLLITPSSVMFTEDFPEVYHKHNGFYQARMMVMRLINHWGYNTANYDTDAIILQNPQSIYDADEYADFDIIAGFAISFPPALHKKWGATLCNGAWMVRSNHRTGKNITMMSLYNTCTRTHVHKHACIHTHTHTHTQSNNSLSLRIIVTLRYSVPSNPYTHTHRAILGTRSPNSQCRL